MACMGLTNHLLTGMILQVPPPRIPVRNDGFQLGFPTKNGRVQKVTWHPVVVGGGVVPIYAIGGYIVKHQGMDWIGNLQRAIL